MCFNVTDNTVALTMAINDFNATYHQDYFTVRAEAHDYLSKSPSTASASRLAPVLIRVLKDWGSGKRGAPACQSVDVAAKALCNAALHEKLVKLARSFEYLSLTDGERSLKDDAPFKTVKDFDVCLIEALRELAVALLVGNTNVTYPMKALLLITGLMPAFDSQVRGGLHVAGLSGFGYRNGQPRTRYLVPTHGSADARRICVLPFYIAECISRVRPFLDAAIANSSYPTLKGQDGRLFDILLFVQRRLAPETALISFSTTQVFRPWYAI